MKLSDRIYQVLSDAKKPMRPVDIAASLPDFKRSHVETNVWRMAEQGRIVRTEDSRYALHCNRKLRKDAVDAALADGEFIKRSTLEKLWDSGYATAKSEQS